MSALERLDIVLAELQLWRDGQPNNLYEATSNLGDLLEQVREQLAEANR